MLFVDRTPHHQQSERSPECTWLALGIELVVATDSHVGYFDIT